MNLPLEILRECCAYLEHTHRPSVAVCSLVSRQWRAAALGFILRRIHIQLGSPDKLQHDVEQWLQVLRSNDSLKDVRRVEVESCLVLAASEEPHQRDDPWLKDYDEDDVFAKVPYGVGSYIDTKTDNAVKDNEYVWEPLAHLIRQLPGLSDLVYAASNSFPPLLLETLHNYKIDCRLHILTWKLRSLKPPDVIDPFELELATSPCLYSVRLHYQRYGRTDSQMLAVTQMASGLAPNLKKIAATLQPASGELRDWDREAREPTWEGFRSVEDRSTWGRGSLSSLDLGTHGQEALETWTKYCDPSSLQTLKLQRGWDLEFFSWAAKCGIFRSLTTLIIDVDLRGGLDDSMSWTDHTRDAVMSFFQSILPLRNLQVSTDLGLEFLDTILERHGCALRRLWLPYNQQMQQEPCKIATAHQVLQIVQLCHSLEDLTLTIPRSKGDRDEVAIYRSLGQHPRLRRLALTLDCSYPYTEVETLDSISFDGKTDGSIDDPLNHRRFRGELIQSALINTAVDADLARSIFRKIDQSKPPGAFRLARLELSVAGGACAFACGYTNAMYDTLTSDLISVLGRQWLCEPHPRDDKRNEVVVTELDQLAREKAENDAGIKLWEYETAFRKVWPKSEDDDWRKDWHSFPLQDADQFLGAWFEAQELER